MTGKDNQNQGCGAGGLGSASCPKLYKVSEVAELFRVSERTVYNWIDWGYMRAIKIGDGRGTIRVPEDSINEFILNNQTVIESLPSVRELLRKTKN